MMKSFARHVCRIAFALVVSTLPAFAQQKIDPALTAPIRAYEAAVNASNIDGVMAVYTDDAVFMPQNNPPIQGKGAVKAAYEELFTVLDLDIDFTFDEARMISDEWAFVRTRSGGTIKLTQKNNATVPNTNQELFLLRRAENGPWLIARYIFATTAPAQ